MKIRCGFVSNSSSSSFLVKAKSTREIAEIMMEHWLKRFIDSGSDDEEYHVYHKKQFDENINKVSLDTTPITMPWTCNYETYIFHYKDDLFMVDTCNNHEFWDSDLNIIKSGDCVSEIIPDEEYYAVKRIEDNSQYFDLTDGRFKTSKIVDAEKGYAHEINYPNCVSDISEFELDIFIKSLFKWYDINIVKEVKVNNNSVFITIINNETNEIFCKFELTNWWDIKNIEGQPSIFYFPNFSIINYFNLLLAFGYIKQKGVKNEN